MAKKHIYTITSTQYDLSHLIPESKGHRDFTLSIGKSKYNSIKKTDFDASFCQVISLFQFDV